MNFQDNGQELTGKIAVYGGTFNPFHMGHLLTAQTAADQFGLQKVILMPSGNSYMKDQAEILDAQTRIRLIELSIENNPLLMVSAMETERPGRTYTYETMLRLREKHPQVSWSFLMGADSLMAMERWRNPEKILENCRILVASRGEWQESVLLAKADELRRRYGGEIELMPERRIDISSSEIRERIRAHRSVRYMLAEKAYEYLTSHHLYLW